MLDARRGGTTAAHFSVLIRFQLRRRHSSLIWIDGELVAHTRD